MCKVMQHYENIAREEERELIAKEMKQKDDTIEQNIRALAQKDSTIANQQAELAALRAQLAALTQRA